MTMSLQAYPAVQSPFLSYPSPLPRLPIPSTIAPKVVPPIHPPMSGAGPEQDSAVLIEVAERLIRAQALNRFHSGRAVRNEHAKGKSAEAERRTHDTAPPPASTLQRLFTSIRQNLEEVYSVIAHYPKPRPDCHERDGWSPPSDRAQETGDEKSGNTGRWKCKFLPTSCSTSATSEIEAEMDEAWLYDTGSDFLRSPSDFLNGTRIISKIPQYVFDYAPLVHLFSGEEFWPCDIADHLDHVTPNLNYTPILSRTENLNLTNLDKLNEWNKGRNVYLTSDDNVEERPDWLGGQKNIPDTPEEPPSNTAHGRHPHADPRLKQKSPPVGGRSDAPAVLIVVDKGHGIVDAFWFYFYSYNLGNVVLNVRFGNHVGDWEHSLIRFQHGKPKLVYFSEHFFGSAYSYDAVEKIGKRPVVYSATGTHAMYATAGLHPYILPLGLLHDETDRGPLWDPALNALSYTYHPSCDTFPFTSSPSSSENPSKTLPRNPSCPILRPSNHTPAAPTEWFDFNGHWGDRAYPLSDPRQYQFAGQYHYVSGPLGPRWKRLARKNVCGSNGGCKVRHWIGGEGVRIGPGWGSGGGDGHEDL